MLYRVLFTVLIFVMYAAKSQHIKTVQLRPLNAKAFAPIVPLGSGLQLSFDDLDANNKTYQYKIEHMTHDWKPSNMSSNQYINGFQQNYINEVTNSFNTLQNYTHYSVKIPNSNSIITKSGNYVISVLNDDEEVVFSRRCVFFEPLTTVGVAVYRSRNTAMLNKQQTIQFIINYADFPINNPAQELQVVLFQNHNWNTAITNLKPQFFKSNQLVYNYTNGTNFFGGNEYRNFDSKRIRNTNMNIVKTEQKNIWHHYLYLDQPFARQNYMFNPDINGQFIIRTLDGYNSADEADYTMTHFSLEALQPLKNKDAYVYGAFNNFNLSEENKMSYSKERQAYEATILLKQGFYNYKYVTVDHQENINLYEIDGSFYQTENEYTVIVYHRPFGGIYDRVIGVGKGFFNQNR